MGGLSVSSKILDKYFGYLKNLDKSAKKSLIVKLTKSMEVESKKDIDLRSIYGAWTDKRTSDEIIAEIRASRIEKIDTNELE